MIRETIVTTANKLGDVHIAPMGIHVENDVSIIMPFKPSTTLNNILETGVAVINYCDDVRVFAGCLTRRRLWPLISADKIAGKRLKSVLAHTEVELLKIEHDETRPKLFCKRVHAVTHQPFEGFNRAQFAVLEAAILISRLDRLPLVKIESEIDYLRIGFEKTAGDREREAWSWLMETLNDYKGKITQ